MSSGTPEKRPVRAGVYSTIDSASDAVDQLRDAGFTSDQISVVCSEEHAQEHFGKYTEEPSGSHTGPALSYAAAAGGLGLGGAAAVSTLVLSSGTALVVVGAFAGLAITGTLVSLFATRGVEKEVADFHDQALQGGDLLVAVEVHGDDADAWLAKADEVFRATGAKPLPLAEG